jgi:hypothetical protein
LTRFWTRIMGILREDSILNGLVQFVNREDFGGLHYCGSTASKIMQFSRQNKCNSQNQRGL